MKNKNTLYEQFQAWYSQYCITSICVVFILLAAGMFFYDFSHKHVNESQWKEVQAWLIETPELKDPFTEFTHDKILTGKEYLTLLHLHKNLQTSPSP